MITDLFINNRTLVVEFMDDLAYLKKIGKNIKKIRVSKGITQVELAYMCNFEKTNMNRIEGGNNNPTIRTLLKIANALEVDLLDILKP